MLKQLPFKSHSPEWLFFIRLPLLLAILTLLAVKAVSNIVTFARDLLSESRQAVYYSE